MKRQSSPAFLLAFAAVTSSIWLGGAAAQQPPQAPQPGAAATSDEKRSLPELPTTPSVRSAAQPVFVQWVELEQPYQSDFRAERPSVRAGWLVVVRAESALLTPRSLAEPLLLAAGDGWTASVEWMQHGHTSGHRVCFIPFVEDAKRAGSPSGSIKARASLRGLRIWFGTPELPERVDAAMLTRELALAQANGLEPTRADQMPASSADLALADRGALVARMRQLAAKWCPAEVDIEASAPSDAR